MWYQSALLHLHQSVYRVFDTAICKLNQVFNTRQDLSISDADGKFSGKASGKQTKKIQELKLCSLGIKNYVNF
uniref:Uncharacterized protein n=1 Tax=Arundo donax TaxID=35708 RepID=A0A0A9GQC3_ARUDO